MKYQAKDFENATDLYLQSLVGLDFGDDTNADHAAEARASVQVPVLCNLTACALQCRRFNRAVVLADTALALDPECWKAHSRKGLAFLELGDFVAARRALRDACACAPEPADQRAVRRELRRLQEREKRAKDGEQRQRRAFSKAMVISSSDGGLYEDVQKKRVSSLRSSRPVGEDARAVVKAHKRTEHLERWRVCMGKWPSSLFYFSAIAVLAVGVVAVSVSGPVGFSLAA